MTESKLHPTAPQPERLLYSRTEAARMLSISVRSLDYLIEKKKLKAGRYGKKVLISIQELRRIAALIIEGGL